MLSLNIAFSASIRDRIMGICFRFFFLGEGGGTKMESEESHNTCKLWSSCSSGFLI